jgi:hypothetical protein
MSDVNVGHPAIKKTSDNGWTKQSEMKLEKNQEMTITKWKTWKERNR